MSLKVMSWKIMWEKQNKTLKKNVKRKPLVKQQTQRIDLGNPTPQGWTFWGDDGR